MGSIYLRYAAISANSDIDRRCKLTHAAAHFERTSRKYSVLSFIKPGLATALILTSAACAHRPSAHATDPTTVGSAARPQGEVVDFAASAGERVFFDYDQFNLRPDARRTLEQQASWLLRNPAVRVIVAGHCDERGTREYNLSLGARRAAAARDYLVSLGVSPSRIDTVSFGKDRPLDSRASEDGWAINRHAHTQVVGVRTS